MFEIWFDRRGATLYLLVWTLLGCSFAGAIVSTGSGVWINALLFALPVTIMYAFVTGFSAASLCRAFPLGSRTLSTVCAVFGFAALLLSAFWTGTAHVWNDLWQASHYDWAGIALNRQLSWLMFGLGVLLYLLSVALQYLLIEFARAQEAKKREMESVMMAQEAELRMLRTQIDPHFLFNSLNSISALTSINPAMAREMTQQLADFFRHSLGLEAHKKVTLEDEIRLTMHFLAVETVRFGARLQVEQSIDPDANACLLPPMIIQPLVENAVKHGIGNLTEGGTIRIVCRRAASRLVISVENPVDADTPPMVPARPGARDGIGLSNVRQRLQVTYAHDATIHWQRRANRFWVELNLPAEIKE